MRPHRALDSLSTRTRSAAIFPCLLLALLLLALPGSVSQAAPGEHPSTESRMQNVDYMSPEAARRLELDFPVLIPPYVPAPFSGEPAIDGGGGYYSVYWMVSAGAPTFLQVTGEAGGSLPAGSPYDLNNQLSVNATVQGYEAIHDVTPAYDAVWWIAGGVVYKVESLNMEGAGTLDLANSLIALEPPAAAPQDPEVPTEPSNPGDPTESAEEPAPTASVEPGASEGQGGDIGPGEQAVDTGSESGPASVAPVPGDVTVETPTPTDGPVGGTASSGGASSDGTGSGSVASDGTGGPAPPVVGSDGTGGTNDLSLTP